MQQSVGFDPKQHAEMNKRFDALGTGITSILTDM